MMSRPSDFPLDGMELSTPLGRWTVRVCAIDVMREASMRVAVTLAFEGTPPYQVRVHFPDRVSLPSRAAGDDVTWLLALVRDWLQSPDPKVRDLVVGDAVPRGKRRRPSAGFPFTIAQGVVHVLVPPDPTPEAFEITVQQMLADTDYRSGMGILYDRRLAPPPTSEYLEAVVALTSNTAMRSAVVTGPSSCGRTTP